MTRPIPAGVAQVVCSTPEEANLSNMVQPTSSTCALCGIDLLVDRKTLESSAAMNPGRTVETWCIGCFVQHETPEVIVDYRGDHNHPKILVKEGGAS